EDYGPQPLTIEDVRMHFANAQDHGNGLWAVIYVDEEQTKLDLMPYVKGRDANPSSDAASASAVLNVGFRSGKFNLKDVVAAFDEFPDLPHAITFINGSWFYWEQACAGHAAGEKSIQACLDRGLSRERLQIMLAFKGLNKAGEYFILKFD